MTTLTIYDRATNLVVWSGDVEIDQISYVTSDYPAHLFYPVIGD